MAEKTKGSGSDQLAIEDESGMAERFQRGLRRAFQMPHKPHQAVPEDTAPKRPRAPHHHGPRRPKDKT